MKIPRFRLVLAILAAASVGVAGLTSISVVRSSDVGVVLRFGEFLTLVEPGLHFRAPFGIDRVVDVPTQRLLQEELGHRSSAHAGGGPTEESEMLTGELDMSAVRWSVLYRITDPMDYLSQLRTPGCVVRAVSRSVMGALVGDRTTQEVISSDHGELEDEAQRILQELLDRYRSGVEIQDVLILENGPRAEEARPPDRRSFDSCSVERESRASRSGFGLTPFFPLPEWEQALLLEFGRPVGEPITQPGLHLKLPLVQEVRFVDRRLLVFAPGGTEVITQDRKTVWVGPLVLWRITDPLTFYERLRDEDGATPRLHDIVDGEIRSAIAEHPLVQLIRSSDRLSHLESPPDASAPSSPTHGKRETIRRELLEAANDRVQDLGLEIVDLRWTTAPPE